MAAKQSSPRPAPRLYLIAAPHESADALGAALGALAEAADVAAVLVHLPQADDDAAIKYAKAIAPALQTRGTAVLLDGRADLVARAGTDGAHLHGFDALKEAIEALKPERIAGAGALPSRHDAMLAVEAGADYVMFGEADRQGRRPGFDAVIERVSWWAELFEMPCVAYAAGMGEIAPLVSAGADFIAVGDFVLNTAQPIATIQEIERHLLSAEPVS
jgi:thiamine-phosphate pyrophosphorylase